MGFNPSPRFALSAALLLALAPFAAGCGAPQPKFALRVVVDRDKDLEDHKFACRDGKPAAKVDDPCAPESYESSFAWDAADNTVFRPVAKFFAVDPGGEAKNVNAFDETPDSSWFTARISAKGMTPDEVANGPCLGGPELDPEDADGSWVIDHGKDNGANPGFRVKHKGTKYMMKADDAQVERASAATAIAARFYFAAGWFAPCDSIVYFRKSVLKLTPGLEIKANVGPSKKLDQKALDDILEKTSKRGDLFRMAASRWLPGKPLGPFRYESVRDDDPNDVIPHQDRRDLRGARVMAAWLNHFDSREQNSMDTWMQSEKDPESGHVQHWYIDLGDSFGSEWSEDGFSRRHGHSYLLDFEAIGADFITFGIPKRPWDEAQRTDGAENFGYYSARDFAPEDWKGEYPNPTFSRATEHDDAWATRIIARFTEAHVAAAVWAGKLTSDFQTQWLTRILMERRRLILHRYFAKLSPLTDPKVNDHELCVTDLARSTATYDASAFAYTADVRPIDGAAVSVPVEARGEGAVCLQLPASDIAASVPPSDRSRYRIVRIYNHASRGPLVVHAYDLGAPDGVRVVGLERPFH